MIPVTIDLVTHPFQPIQEMNPAERRVVTAPAATFTGQGGGRDGVVFLVDLEREGRPARWPARAAALGSATSLRSEVGLVGRDGDGVGLQAGGKAVDLDA